MMVERKGGQIVGEKAAERIRPLPRTRAAIAYLADPATTGEVNKVVPYLRLVEMLAEALYDGRKSVTGSGTVLKSLVRQFQDRESLPEEVRNWDSGRRRKTGLEAGWLEKLLSLLRKEMVGESKAGQKLLAAEEAIRTEIGEEQKQIKRKALLAEAVQYFQRTEKANLPSERLLWNTPPRDYERAMLTAWVLAGDPKRGIKPADKHMYLQLLSSTGANGNKEESGIAGLQGQAEMLVAAGDAARSEDYRDLTTQGVVLLVEMRIMAGQYADLNLLQELAKNE